MNKAERKRLERLSSALEDQIREAQQELVSLRIQLAEPDFVSVVYVRPGDESNLLKRSAFAYYNGIGEDLKVGDTVIAPTRYNANAIGIVVALTKIQDDGYPGPFKTITEFAYGEGTNMRYPW